MTERERFEMWCATFNWDPHQLGLWSAWIGSTVFQPMVKIETQAPYEEVRDAAIKAFRQDEKTIL